jgi:hypothetical protein
MFCEEVKRVSQIGESDIVKFIRLPDILEFGFPQWSRRRSRVENDDIVKPVRRVALAFSVLGSTITNSQILDAFVERLTSKCVGHPGLNFLSILDVIDWTGITRVLHNGFCADHVKPTFIMVDETFQPDELRIFGLFWEEQGCDVLVRDVLQVLAIFTFWVVGIDDFGSGLEECLVVLAEETVQGEVLSLAVGGAIIRCLASRASHSCPLPTNSAFGRSHL